MLKKIATLAPLKYPRAAIRSIPTSLILNRSPIQPGAAPEPTAPLGPYPRETLKKLNASGR